MNDSAEPAQGVGPRQNTGQITGQKAGRNQARNQNRNPNRKRARGNNPRAAVIDLGTNNCRLLIAEQFPGGGRGRAPAFRIVDSFSKIVRLGEGLGQTGALSNAAIERTILALDVCARLITKSGVKEVRAVATQACRQASNGEAFLERVKAETGLTLKTISPREEVQLGISSTLPLLRRKWPYALIFDVGGGSTEISFLRFKEKRGFQMLDSLSVPLGVVGLSEAHTAPESDLDTPTYEHMRTLVREAFAEFSARNDIVALQGQGLVQTVGMSGTVTTVKALDLGLKTYRRAAVDRTTFEMARLGGIRDRLIREGHAGLIANGCIGKDRSDLVLPGTAILDGLGDAFGFERLLVLDRGLREGLLHDIFKRHDRKAKRRGGQKPHNKPKEGAEHAAAPTLAQPPAAGVEGKPAP